MVQGRSSARSRSKVTRKPKTSNGNSTTSSKGRSRSRSKSGCNNKSGSKSSANKSNSKSESKAINTNDNHFALLRVEEVPAWIIDNPHILRGYRRPDRSVGFYMLSIFTLHNETINIWTHLIGFIIFAILAFDQFWNDNNGFEVDDHFVFGVFYTGAMIMFLLSTMLHTFQTVGEVYNPILARLDYIGISCMIVGSMIPIFYYAFHCERGWYHFHSLAITAFGLGTLIFIFAPNFHLPSRKKARALMFVCFGLYAVFPLGQFILGPVATVHMIETVLYTATVGALYLFGALLYANTLPEAFKPDGTFDLIGSSHQIWHCFVLAAAITHYYAVFSAYESRKIKLSDCLGPAS